MSLNQEEDETKNSSPVRYEIGDEFLY